MKVINTSMLEAILQSRTSAFRRFDLPLRSKAIAEAFSSIAKKAVYELLTSSPAQNPRNIP